MIVEGIKSTNQEKYALRSENQAMVKKMKKIEKFIENMSNRGGQKNRRTNDSSQNQTAIIQTTTISLNP